MRPKHVVFTDLDGSLLDHYSYSFRSALPVLRQLERRGVPVIPVSSKTRAELEPLRDEMANEGPFIVENGAAIFIPEGYFEHQPADSSARDGYWVREFVGPRQRWVDLLDALRPEFPEEFDCFASVAEEGIAAMTGLSLAAAALANRREYTEPFRWRGTDERLKQFLALLQASGANVQEGGRFLSVGGDCDKGKALIWLRNEFQRSFNGVRVADLAIGDSGNDRAMLEVAGSAVLVRSPEHDYPELRRSSGVMRSLAYGPEGWAEGVSRWLLEQDANDQQHDSNDQV